MVVPWRDPYFMVYEIIPIDLGSISSPKYPKQPGCFHCSCETSRAVISNLGCYIYLQPETTSSLWLFQLDDSKSLHGKWLELTKHPLTNRLFRVRGISFNSHYPSHNRAAVWVPGASYLYIGCLRLTTAESVFFQKKNSQQWESEFSV